MKIRYFSDIHSEIWFEDFFIDSLPTDKDTELIIAGDLGRLNDPMYYEHLLERFSEQFRGVIFVAGNHEFYHSNIEKCRISTSPRTYISKESIAIITATLWTDLDNSNKEVMEFCSKNLNDFFLISKNVGLFKPEDMIELHKREKEYIFEEIVKYKEKGYKVIVVTHHAPSQLSAEERYKNSKLNFAFCNSLENEILETKPDIWIHGHCHCCSDYKIGNTRVLTNTIGYPREQIKYDKKSFIEI